MHVYQLPNGRWRAIIQQNGQRRSVHGATRAEALLKGSKLAVQLGETRRRGAHTITDMIGRHLADTAHNLSPSTLAEYNRVIDWMPDELADADINHVESPDLTAWYRRLLADGWSIGSVRRLHELLHVAWKHTAIHLGWTSTNPATSARPPARAPHRIDPPDPETVRRLLAAADDRYRLYLRLAATTGARRGELVALRWADLNLERGEVLITRSHVYTPETGVTERATKTGRSGHRRLALDPDTVAGLERHRDHQAKLAADAGFGDPVWVFSHDAGVSAWHPDYPTTAFRRLRDATGIRGVRLHDLRHYVATRMLARGESLPQVGARLGHADPRTTLSFYSHWVPARDRDAATALADELDG